MSSADHYLRPWCQRFFSTKQVAEALGVSESTIKRRIRDGTLRSVKFGARRLVHISAIDELAKPFTTPAPVLDRRRKRR